MNPIIATPTYTSFSNDRKLVSGDLEHMLRETKRALGDAPHLQILIFDDRSGKQIDFDFRGSVEEVLERYEAGERKPGPGRPKLGVVSREISLLPRHWEWLADQPRGASATLRRLVDEAAGREDPASLSRRAAAATGRAMTVLAGDRVNFEEAYRALDRGEGERFEALTREWPPDVSEYLSALAAPALSH